MFFKGGKTLASSFYSINVLDGQVDRLDLSYIYLNGQTDATGIYEFLVNVSLVPPKAQKKFIHEVSETPEVSEALDRAVVEKKNDPDALRAMGRGFLGSWFKNIREKYEDWVKSTATYAVADHKELAKLLGVLPEDITYTLEKNDIPDIDKYVTVTDAWVEKLVSDVVDTFKSQLDFSGWREFLSTSVPISTVPNLTGYVVDYVDEDIWNGTLFDIQGFREDMLESLTSLSTEG